MGTGDEATAEEGAAAEAGSGVCDTDSAEPGLGVKEKPGCSGIAGPVAGCSDEAGGAGAGTDTCNSGEKGLAPSGRADGWTPANSDADGGG